MRSYVACIRLWPTLFIDLPKTYLAYSKHFLTTCLSEFAADLVYTSLKTQVYEIQAVYD
jgi:hypothetical protein